MGAQFTPGPWAVGEVRHAGAFQLVNAGPRGYVCEVRCGYVGNELDHATREANAHLIAAAPDLYEALEAMIAAELSGSGAAMAKARHVARDALAKARGDQS